VIDHIRSLGARVGVTLNPGTEVSEILPVIEEVDQVLVMSVWPGFGGQDFIPSSLEKLEQVARRLRPDQRLEIDGGIDPETIEAAARAGADTFVAGSAIFGEPDPVEAMNSLRRLAIGTRTASP
jgi:ribulose-phosphate 3-epimerase